MGMSSSVSSSSSSFGIPGGGPSGMGISSSVFSAYMQFNQQASILGRINVHLLPLLVHRQEQRFLMTGHDVEDEIPVFVALGVPQHISPFS